MALSLPVVIIRDHMEEFHTTEEKDGLGHYYHRHLQPHEEQLNDRFARKNAYPMGICHVRLKRSGA